MVVGTGAALTHLAIFALLQSQHMLAAWPEIANALAFAVAFGVSYAGHRNLSFKDASTTARQSFARFACTALAGLATNEMVFSFLLRYAGLPALLALCIALVVAAAQTYGLSRFWAFRK